MFGLSLALGVVSNPAQACTCGPDAWFYPALPEHEAVDVPTNVRIVYQHGTEHHGAGYTLQTIQGEHVAVDLLPSSGVTILQPRQLLEPDTVYVLLESKGPYGFERATQTFTTGAGPDTASPQVTPKASGSAHYSEDCFDREGWSASVRGSVEPDETPVLMEAELTTQAGGVHRRLSLTESVHLTEVGCWPNFGFDDITHLDVRVRALDLAGNVGPWSNVVSLETPPPDSPPSDDDEDTEDTGAEPTTAGSCETAPASGALAWMMLWLWPRRRGVTHTSTSRWNR